MFLLPRLQPTCFGYEYLTAIEAFDQESGLPDLENFRGSLSEMLSMKLTSQISDIIDVCADGNQDPETKTTCKFFTIPRIYTTFAHRWHG